MSNVDRGTLILAWHDANCPEGPDCRSRDVHAQWAGFTTPINRVADVLETSGWLQDHTQQVGEKIAEAIHAAKPPHMTRDYTPVDQAYDDCARIARTLKGVKP